jgi:hypothetical protein
MRELQGYPREDIFSEHLKQVGIFELIFINTANNLHINEESAYNVGGLSYFPLFLAFRCGVGTLAFSI